MKQSTAKATAFCADCGMCLDEAELLAKESTNKKHTALAVCFYLCREQQALRRAPENRRFLGRGETYEAVNRKSNGILRRLRNVFGRSGAARKKKI